MKRRNRKLRKALLMTCCALALVAISVGATLAYLTDTEAVTNVFTVGQVGISLDESEVYTIEDTIPAGKEHGQIIVGVDPVQENEYHLIPGKTYDKNPTVHVDANSEDSWIFVKVENGIVPIEAAASYAKEDGSTATGTIADQIAAFGWTKLTGVDNVYYREHTKANTETDYVVFKNFKVSGEAHNKPILSYDPNNEEEAAAAIRHNSLILSNYQSANNGPVVNVTAYAIQKTGFNSAAEAWTAGCAQNADWNN